MPNMINSYSQFSKHQTVYNLSKLKQQPYIDIQQLLLPKVSAIHLNNFNRFTDHFNSSNLTLLSGITETSSSIEDLEKESIEDELYSWYPVIPEIGDDWIGYPKKKSLSIPKILRSYIEGKTSLQWIKDIKMLKNIKNMHTVVDYMLMDTMFYYTGNEYYREYIEWYNYTRVLWKMVEQLSPIRWNFYKLHPIDNLPEYHLMDKYAKLYKPGIVKQDRQLLKIFDTEPSFDVLHLWYILGKPADDIKRLLGINNTSTLKKFHYIIPDNQGRIVILNLYNIIELSSQDLKAFKKAFYAILENNKSYVPSEPLELRKVEVIRKSDTVDMKDIEDIVYSDVSIGKKTDAQAKRIITIANKSLDIEDPVTKKPIKEYLLKKTSIALNKEPIVHKNSIVPKDMQTSTITAIDTLYRDHAQHTHILKTIYSMMPAGIIPMKIERVPVKDAVNDLLQYNIKYITTDGKESTIHILIPRIRDDGSYYIGGTKYYLMKQRGDIPISKISDDTVALTSYYGKVFVRRNNYSAYNYERWITAALIKASSDPDNTLVTDIKFIQQSFNDIELPRSYTAIAKSIQSVTIGDYIFDFDYHRLQKKYGKTEVDHKIIVGKDKQGTLLLMDKYGDIYRGKENLGRLDFILTGEYKAPMEFSEIELLGNKVPIGCIMVYRYGMDRFLQLAGIPYKKELPDTRISPKRDQVVLKFEDTAYVIDAREPEHQYLLGGLVRISKSFKNVPSQQIQKKNIASMAFSHYGVSPSLLNEVDLMWKLFIDPITLEVLEELGEPTIFAGLLQKANKLLLLDSYNDKTGYRIKGHERITGIMYRELIKGLRNYNNFKGFTDKGFTINEHEYWMNVVNEQAMIIADDLNPIAGIKERETITYTGFGGRSGRALAKKDRGFSKEDVGLLSEATPDSGKVGVRVYSTADPKLKNLLGMIDFDKDIKNMTAANVLNTTTLLAPGADHDDAKRVNFINIQLSHLTGVDDYDLQGFRTDYSMVFPYRATSRFIDKAIGKGRVVDIKEEEYIKVKYDKDIVVYPLGKIHAKAPNGYVHHVKVTTLKKGDTVDTNDIITYVKGFFKPDFINAGQPSMTFGVTARVALVNEIDTLEDGSGITLDFANRLNTSVTEVRNIVVDFTESVYGLVKVGDKVRIDTPLCTILDHFDESSFNENDKETLQYLRRIAAHNPKPKHNGVVAKIEVLYHGKLGDMTNSLRTIAQKDNRERKRLKEQFMDDRAETGEVTTDIMVEGKKLLKNNMVIKIYIDYTLKMHSADKLVIGNALKTTVSRIYSDPITDTKGRHIDAKYSWKGVEDRIVFSPIIMGTMNTLQKEINKRMVDIYFS